jgi:uncharacterized delta-60 repeat protein
MVAALVLAAPAVADEPQTWRVYSPTSAVRASDGSLVSTSSLGVVRIAPDGQVTETGLAATDLATLPDGGLLMADSETERVRRLFPDGHVETVAGGGHDGPGCLATRVRLDDGGPGSASPTPDGGMVLTDRYHVRRVWPDGSLTTLPLRPEPFVLNDAEPLPEGGYLVAGYGAVWRIAPDGSSRVVAGDPRGSNEYTGEGGPASRARLGDVAGVAPLLGGGYLLSDRSFHAIRKVDAAGIITTVKDGIEEPMAINADPAGGALVADRHGDEVLSLPGPFAPPVLAPVSGGYQGTGGYTDACQGFDPSFSGGSVALGYAEDAAGMVVQPGGRLVLAGSGGFDVPQPRFVLRRLRTDGRADPSFGDDGVAHADVGENVVRAYGVVRQSTGRLVIAGRVFMAPSEPVRDAFVGFTPDGQIDPSFGDDGVALVPAGDGAPLARIAVAPDDRIVMADGNRFVGLLPDGRLDPGFGDHGIAPLPIGGEALTVQPDGRIVSAGGDLRVARYLRDGSLDPSFAPVAAPRKLTPWFKSRAIALDGAGRILVGGYDENAGPAELMRVNPDGSRDASFGDAGMTTLRAESGAYQPILQLEALEARADGRIVVAGEQWSARGGQTVLVLQPDGSLDPSFGTGGRVVSQIARGGPFLGAASLPGGKLLAAGSAIEASYVAARYLLPAAPPARSQPAAATTSPPGPVSPAPRAPARPRARLRLLAPAHVSLRRLRRSGFRLRVYAAGAGRLTLTASVGRKRVARRTLALRRGVRVVRLRARRAPRPRPDRVGALLIRARLVARGAAPQVASARVAVTRR